MIGTHAPIGELVDVVKNWNPTTRPQDEFLYIDLSAVSQNEKRVVSPGRVLGAEAPSRARQLVRRGDILVSTVRPNLNGVAAVTNEFDGATASTGFCVLRPKAAKLATEYLMHWVQSPKFIGNMVREATGASYPAVSDRIVKSSLIPLPPLDEQRRIAAILDKADALRRKRNHALELLNGLTQSIFLQMFDQSASSREEMQRVELKDVCQLIRDGAHKTPSYVENGVPFVTVKNITTGSLDLTSTKFISNEEHRELTRRAKPEQGDILVSKDGTIGIPCIVPDTKEFSIFVSVALLKLKRDRIDPTFLCEQIRSAAVQRQIREHSKGIAIRHLHLSDFARLRIVVPAMDQQRQFGDRVYELNKQRKRAVAHLQSVEALFSSLQHRAFIGQL